MLRPDERALLDASEGAVLTVEDDGLIAHANAEAMVLLGWDPTLLGKPLATIIPARLRARHWVGFQRYVRSGESRLQGSTVRLPALRQNGSEVEVDLTIRVFRRPDGSKMVSAALVRAPTGRPPPGLRVLEDALARRLYELV